MLLIQKFSKYLFCNTFDLNFSFLVQRSINLPGEVDSYRKVVSFVRKAYNMFKTLILVRRPCYLTVFLVTGCTMPITRREGSELLEKSNISPSAFQLV